MEAVISMLVIPAKAGIQFLIFVIEKKPDSSFRWNDERKACR